MSAQAELMKEYVQRLVDIVGSGGEAGFFEHFARKDELEAPDDGTMESIYEEDRHLPEPKTLGRVPEKKGKEVRPNEVIPMDDDDFQDF